MAKIVCSYLEPRVYYDPLPAGTLANAEFWQQSMIAAQALSPLFPLHEHGYWTVVQSRAAQALYTDPVFKEAAATAWLRDNRQSLSSAEFLNIPDGVDREWAWSLYCRYQRMYWTFVEHRLNAGLKAVFEHMVHRLNTMFSLSDKPPPSNEWPFLVKNEPPDSKARGQPRAPTLLFLNTMRTLSGQGQKRTTATATGGSGGAGGGGGSGGGGGTGGGSFLAPAPPSHLIRVHFLVKVKNEPLSGKDRFEPLIFPGSFPPIKKIGGSNVPARQGQVRTTRFPGEFSVKKQWFERARQVLRPDSNHSFSREVSSEKNCGSNVPDRPISNHDRYATPGCNRCSQGVMFRLADRNLDLNSLEDVRDVPTGRQQPRPELTRGCVLFRLADRNLDLNSLEDVRDVPTGRPQPRPELTGGCVMFRLADCNLDLNSLEDVRDVPTGRPQPRPELTGGCVMFRLADRNLDLNSLQDVLNASLSRGLRACPVNHDSFSGWSVQRYEFFKQKIQAEKVFAEILFSQSHDESVAMVARGACDVGMAQTNTFERLIHAHAYAHDTFVLINEKHHAHFHELVSTDLYHEWPFAVMPHVEEEQLKVHKA
eukprot:g5879.t1